MGFSQRLFRKHEFYLVLTIAILSVIIGLINNAFFTVGNLFSLIRSCIVTGIFALGVHMVIVSGDIDVSFMAIATFSMYVTGRFLINNPQYADNLFLAFAMSAVIGMCLGALNAWFISTFKLPTFVVTLGTQNVYRGFLLAFIGTRLITTLPKCMLDLSRSNLVSVRQGRILYSLPNTIWFLVVLTIITWLIMRYTKLGRGIYAIGGDPVAAERVGFNIARIRLFMYSYVGFLAGIAGIIHASMIRIGNPFDLVGQELNVIAAVILGGTKITGGEGSVLGTLLGVFLLTMITNSLILMGISSYWQRVAIGLILIASIAVTTYRERRGVTKAYA